MKGWNLSFPKKGDLEITKNYKSITLTAIAGKVCNILLLNCIQPEVEKILRKNQDGFLRNQSQNHGFWLSIESLKKYVKSLEATLLFVDFFKPFDSMHRGQMEQILLPYGLSKETVTAIMMLYKSTKVMVKSPNGNTDFFDIVTGVLLGDILVPYLFIILPRLYTMNINRYNEGKWQNWKRQKADNILQKLCQMQIT